MGLFFVPRPAIFLWTNESPQLLAEVSKEEEKIMVKRNEGGNERRRYQVEKTWQRWSD